QDQIATEGLELDIPTAPLVYPHVSVERHRPHRRGRVVGGWQRIDLDLADPGEQLETTTRTIDEDVATSDVHHDVAEHVAHLDVSAFGGQAQVALTWQVQHARLEGDEPLELSLDEGEDPGCITVGLDDESSASHRVLSDGLGPTHAEPGTGQAGHRLVGARDFERRRRQV